MSFCLNPQCDRPHNPDQGNFCLNCGAPLLLRGHYRAIRPLGRGGFARTYLGIDRDRLDTPCAIKQFLPSAKTPAGRDKAIELFTREALRLRDLGDNPQIPALLGFFEEGGYLYLVQEYIAGETIDRELQRSGPFSEAKLLAFLRDLLPVLQFVHDRSTIHRDLKPLNLIRRQRDQRIVPIDFGVAKVLEANTQSRPGTKIGTAGYAPDEQLRGGQAYPASDLYSVGAICVFLLTGVEPEELYNPLTGQWPWREQLAQWRDELSGNGDSLDASQRKHLPVSDSVSEGLGLVLDRLLQPAVTDRYQTALEVLVDLDNIIRTMPPSPYRREESMAVDRDRAKRFWLTRIGTSSGGNFS